MIRVVYLFFFLILFLPTQSKAATASIRINQAEPITLQANAVTALSLTVASDTAWKAGHASLYFYYVTSHNERFGPRDQAVALPALNSGATTQVSVSIDTRFAPTPDFGIIAYVVLDGQVIGPRPNGLLINLKASGNKSTPDQTSLCDPRSQPSPHWGMRDGLCLSSCGGLGGTQSFIDACDAHGLIDAGQAYDVAFCCKAPAVRPTPAPAPGGSASGDFINLVLAGYQGWFSAEGDGGINGWTHWAPGGRPQPGHVTVELYPDVREYNLRDLFDTALGNLGNGTPARLFSSVRDGVVDTHFRWMAEYGIDGAVLQRFVSELSNPLANNVRTEVARKVKHYAENYDRTFYLMYDISGANGATLVRDIQSDWSGIMEGQLQITSSRKYARQDGRPVVGIWGFGFGDRPGTQAQAQELIQWFKNQGYYVVGGVPYNWRTQQQSWHSTYALLNMLQPWSVGAYGTTSEVESQLNTNVLPDKQFCDQHGMHYQRVIYPGFSWSNWNGGRRNQIPRQGGAFLWSQAYALTGVTNGAFVAMFDEYDEGTAIAKAAENASMIPNNQYFLTLDADGNNLSSDYYLRLTGAATRMMQGAAAKTPNIPIAPR